VAKKAGSGSRSAVLQLLDGRWWKPEGALVTFANFGVAFGTTGSDFMGFHFEIPEEG